MAIHNIIVYSLSFIFRQHPRSPLSNTRPCPRRYEGLCVCAETGALCRCGQQKASTWQRLLPRNAPWWPRTKVVLLTVAALTPWACLVVYFIFAYRTWNPLWLARPVADSLSSAKLSRLTLDWNCLRATRVLGLSYPCWRVVVRTFTETKIHISLVVKNVKFIMSLFDDIFHVSKYLVLHILLLLLFLYFLHHQFFKQIDFSITT